MLGKVYRSKSDAAGYFMVMDKTPVTVTLSPIFGWEKIQYLIYPKTYFKDQYIKVKNTSGLHPILQARYDHELMRRLRKI